MCVKKFFYVWFLSGLSNTAVAETLNSTVSLGIANSHYSAGVSGRAPGLNLKYNIDNTDTGSGLVTSVTSTSEKLHSRSKDVKGRVSHFSAMAGPSFSVTEIASLYGLAGISHDRAKLAGVKGREYSFTCGADVRITPPGKWSVDASCEHAGNSNSDKNGETLKLDTWIVGVGYRF